MNITNTVVLGVGFVCSVIGLGDFGRGTAEPSDARRGRAMPGAARSGYITGALAPAAFGWAGHARLGPVVFGWVQHCVARSGNPTAAETSPKLSESGAVRQGMVMQGLARPGKARQGNHTGVGALPKLSRLGVSGQTPAGPSSAAHGPAWQGKAAITGRFSPRSFWALHGAALQCIAGTCTAWSGAVWHSNHHGQETAQSFWSGVARRSWVWHGAVCLGRARQHSRPVNSGRSFQARRGMACPCMARQGANHGPRKWAEAFSISLGEQPTDQQSGDGR